MLAVRAVVRRSCRQGWYAGRAVGTGTQVLPSGQTIGDGLGFDVLSFDDMDESEKLIEVKTTGLGKFFPFYVTINEVRCSEDMIEKFHLFRVFDFARTPRVYILTGSLWENCQLEPIQFMAVI